MGETDKATAGIVALAMNFTLPKNEAIIFLNNDDGECSCGKSAYLQHRAGTVLSFKCFECFPWGVFKKKKMCHEP